MSPWPSNTNVRIAADLDGNDSSNSGTTGSITFNLHVGNNPQESDFENVGAIGTPLYLQLDWMDYTNASVKGTTFSPLFAINNGSDISPSTISVLQAENFRDGASWVAVSNECWDPDCLASPSGSSTVPLETSAQPTASTITTSAATTTAAATATASASPGSGSTGLSIGAIAGIAVGCAVVGLALIGTAVWFLCFRRRHESHTALHQNTGYISDDMGPGVVNDKELPQITDSPHSAYAPDRSLHDPHEVSRNSMGVTGVGAGVGAGTGLMDGAGHAAHGAEVPYTPYSDHTPPPPGVIGTDRGPTSSQTSLPAGGTSSPTPISTRYAHLVEEGMTDDEIRRLEEEERALDMAIEDHGRSSRAQ